MKCKFIKFDYIYPIKNFIKRDVHIGYANANDFIETGIHEINSGNSQSDNFPITNPNGELEIYKASTNSIKQIFTQNGGDCYIRLYWYGLWCSWKKIS